MQVFTHRPPSSKPLSKRLYWSARCSSAPWIAIALHACSNIDALDKLRNVRRVLQNRVNPLQFYSDTDFRNKCRMSKLSFKQLIAELNGHHSGKSWALMMVERLYITIHFLLLTAYRPALGILFWLIKELLIKLFMR